METRLNKHLAYLLGVSRREADELIEQGKVAVNGAKVALGARITPDDIVTLNGQRVYTDARHGYTYLLLNKPKGFVSSRRQQGDTPTIYSLIDTQHHHLKPVGRLDKDSSGLLLLTDDGSFAHRMTHPSFHKQKSYEIALDKPLAPLHAQMITDHGVVLEDGPSKLILEKQADDGQHWIVAMHEGRNRQIRRTFASLGYTVTRLHRTHFGPFHIGNLKQGEFRATQAPEAVNS